MPGPPSSLDTGLDSRAKDAYPSDDLTSLGVSLGSFDPNDQGFLDSELCLFKPLSLKALEEYSLVESELFKFDEIYDHPTNVKNPFFLNYGGESISNLQSPKYPQHPLREEEWKRPPFFDEFSGWDEIK